VLSPSSITKYCICCTIQNGLPRARNKQVAGCSALTLAHSASHPLSCLLNRECSFSTISPSRAPITTTPPPFFLVSMSIVRPNLILNFLSVIEKCLSVRVNTEPSQHRTPVSLVFIWNTQSNKKTYGVQWCNKFSARIFGTYAVPARSPKSPITARRADRGKWADFFVNAIRLFFPFHPFHPLKPPSIAINLLVPSQLSLLNRGSPSFVRGNSSHASSLSSPCLATVTKGFLSP
jgi:hypothetical protein